MEIIPANNFRNELTAGAFARIVQLYGDGASRKEIAALMGWSIKSLQRHIERSPELKRAMDQAKAGLDMQIGGAVISQAKEGNMQACKLYLQTRAYDKWESVQKIETTEKEQKALSVKDMSDEDLRLAVEMARHFRAKQEEKQRAGEDGTEKI